MRKQITGCVESQTSPWDRIPPLEEETPKVGNKTFIQTFTVSKTSRRFQPTALEHSIKCLVSHHLSTIYNLLTVNRLKLTALQPSIETDG